MTLMQGGERSVTRTLLVGIKLVGNRMDAAPDVILPLWPEEPVDVGPQCLELCLVKGTGSQGVM